MADKRRIYKVGERIQAVIATELLRMSDPRFNLVTITSVSATRDLRQAKVYFVVSGGVERREEVAQAFDSATGYLRSVVSKEVGTRYAPQLRFYYDDTLDTVEEVERLFKKIKTESVPFDENDVNSLSEKEQ